MAKTRIVCILALFGVALGCVHIALSLYSGSAVQWIHYLVQGNPAAPMSDRRWKSRTRGLLLECLDEVHGACEHLEDHRAAVNLNDKVHHALNLRTASLALTFLGPIMALTAYIVGIVLFITFRKKAHRRQLVLFIVGLIGWIAALASYFGVITFLEGKKQESYVDEQSITTFRGSWDTMLKDSTVEEFGHVFHLAITASAFGHVGSFFVMAASLWI
ncbi:unnamed protein product [Dicrocoelium dendriticum]|nr:unnamed protein product [Dicrocoelium dendriticum]